ncbi:hypothetical protein DFA_06429 [Cavenderia fasciculata]|uniref:Uncharacterized protein n=1 Tax=Cavenderia fasciculata TaxID=261658 RepID=F4PIZ3_CACFS|nr:uncharacterized protein DFA_06429 [Cavenderia fasciculata]EGG24279.1 hypothetical protein DFA_06429 [Cavenderia fasciculata]|eukprot:XP_004362130.1 hypothetical protein DFA_06429 [Cavenderia fasciculata]
MRVRLITRRSKNIKLAQEQDASFLLAMTPIESKEEKEYRELMCAEWKSDEMVAISGTVLPWLLQTRIIDLVCQSTKVEVRKDVKVTKPSKKSGQKVDAFKNGGQKVDTFKNGHVLVSSVCWRYRRYVAQTYFQEYNTSMSMYGMSHHVFSRYSLYRDIKTLELKYSRNEGLFNDNDHDDDGYPINGRSKQDDKTIMVNVPANVFKQRFGQLIESFSLSTEHSYGHDGDSDDEQDDVDGSFSGYEYASLLSQHMPQLKHLTLCARAESRLKVPSSYKSIIKSIPLQQLSSLTLDISCYRDIDLTESIAKLFSGHGATKSMQQPAISIPKLKLDLKYVDNRILYPALSQYLLSTTSLTDLYLGGIDKHFPLLVAALTRPKSPLKRLVLDATQMDDYSIDLAPVHFTLDYLHIQGRRFYLPIDPTSQIKHIEIRYRYQIGDIEQYIDQNKHLLKLTFGRDLGSLFPFSYHQDDDNDDDDNDEMDELEEERKKEEKKEKREERKKEMEKNKEEDRKMLSIRSSSIVTLSILTLGRCCRRSEEQLLGLFLQFPHLSTLKTTSYFPQEERLSLTLDITKCTKKLMETFTTLLFSGASSVILSKLKLDLKEADNRILYPALSQYLLTTTTLTVLYLGSIDQHFPLLYSALTRPQSPLKRLALDAYFGPENPSIKLAPAHLCLDYLSVKGIGFTFHLNPITSAINHLTTLKLSTSKMKNSTNSHLQVNHSFDQLGINEKEEEEHRKMICADWRSDDMVALAGSVLPWYVQTIVLDHVCNVDSVKNKKSISILVSSVCWRYRRYVAHTYYQEYKSSSMSISDMSHHIFSRYSLYRDIKTLAIEYSRNQSLFDCDQEHMSTLVPIKILKERFGLMIESLSMFTAHSYGNSKDTDDKQDDVDESFRSDEYASLLKHYMPKLKHLTLRASIESKLNLPTTYQSIIESIPIHQLVSLTLEITCKFNKELTKSIGERLFSEQTTISTLKLNLKEPNNQILYPLLSQYLLVTTTLTDLSISGIDDIHFPLLFGALTQSSLKRLELIAVPVVDYCQNLAPAFFSLDYLSIQCRGTFTLHLDPNSSIKHLNIDGPTKISNFSQYMTQNKHLVELRTSKGLDSLVSSKEQDCLIKSSSVKSLTILDANLTSQRAEKQVLDLLTQFPNLTTLNIQPTRKLYPLAYQKQK